MTEKADYRGNEIGISMISEDIRKKMFGELEEASNIAVRLAKKELKLRDYYPLNTSPTKALKMPIPELLGEDLKEHWETIGETQAQPYYDLAWKMRDLNKQDVPPIPENWKEEAGWHRYDKSSPKGKPVKYPEEEVIIFDVETLVQVSQYPIMACALSTEAWYLWLSPAYFNVGVKQELIPLGDNTRLVIAHNANYDIARVKESYSSDYDLDNIRYLDTLSLHTAVSGMSSRQRLIYKTDYQPKWKEHTCPASLKDIVKFYGNEEMEKEDRNYFVNGDLNDIQSRFQKLSNYNANDCLCLLKAYRVLFRTFCQKNPHKVTFAGMLSMSREFLPTTEKTWMNYLSNSSSAYKESEKATYEILKELAEEAIQQWKEDKESVKTDPFLRHLDWNEPSSRARKLKDKPEWYRSLVKKNKLLITAGQDVAKYLLRLEWKQFPVYKHPEHKWGFLVPKDSEHKEVHNPSSFLNSDLEVVEDKHSAFYFFYKIPHKDGGNANVGDLLSKDFLRYFEIGVLSSQNPKALQVLQEKIKCSYWKSSHSRIEEQLVITNENGDSTIIPRLAPMGTITRRATENTWLTASNPKPNKIGTELKQTVRVDSDKYSIVGADVASQEAWLSAVYGDSDFQKIFGCTAYGVQCLIGDKSKKTDFHSSTAKIINDAIKEVCGETEVNVEISRGEAKIFNYSRLYLAGEKSTVATLKELVKGLDEEEYKDIIRDLFAETKGERQNEYGVAYWAGGRESYTFNYLERVARSSDPTTPLLGSKITSALHPINLDNDEFLPSRGNWVVQSSGVDFLHCLITATDYLIHKYGIKARLMLSIHDEYRYLCHKGHEYNLAWAMQVAHLWTRALVVYNLGFTDLPEVVAWFEEVDVDFCLRKEASDPCITPSSPNGEELGKTFTPEEIADNVDCFPPK